MKYKDKQIPFFNTSGLWYIAGLILLLYGLLSLEAGLKTSPIFNKTEGLKDKTTNIINQAEAGEIIENEALIQEVTPLWMTILSKISSQEYAFGRDGILHVDEYYYSIPDEKRLVISTHMMLGILLLLTGFFQFWPTFRRKYRKLHRYFGVIYIAATLLSMTLSIKHLLYAGPANIFSTFVFYVGLFMLAISEFICIGMALYALYKKQFAVHLGWMALSFGFYLTAPVQRINWYLLSLFAENTSFMEMNILVNVTLQNQVILLAYLLFCINRFSSPLKPLKTDTLPANSTPNNAIIGYSGLFFFSLISFRYFVYGKGFALIENFLAIVPEPILTHQSLIYDIPFLSVLFFIGTVMLLWAAYRMILTPPKKEIEMRFEKMMVFMAGLAISAILLFWGYQLGIPTYTHSVAGVGYFQAGIMLLSFLGLWYRAYSREKLFLAKELLMFIIAITISPAMVYVLLYFFDWFNIVPLEYIEKGHAFELAHLLSMTLPLIVVFIITFYSKGTDRYIIN